MSNNYSIVETVLQCSYPVNMRDYIANIVMEITASTSAKVFKILYKNDNILTIKYNIQTKFKDKSYEIPILIYLLKNMPYEAPEVYLERSSETGVNPKNTEIDQKTNRIMTASLTNWSSYFSVLTVIDEITVSFNKNFPIFKTIKNLNTNNSQSFQNSSQLSMPNYGNQSVMGNNSGITGSNFYQPNTFYDYNEMGKQKINNNYSQNNSNPNSTYNSMNNMNASNVKNSTVYSNLYNNLAKNPPHQNTIYHNLYGMNITNSNVSNTNNNSNFVNNNNDPLNLGNSILTSSYNNYTNTFNNSNSMYQSQIQPNFYNNNLKSNQTNPPIREGFNNVTKYNPQLNFNQQWQDVPSINNYNNYQVNKSNILSNMNINQVNQSNFSNDQSQQVDNIKMEEEIKKIIIGEIKNNIENKIKEELKRYKQVEERLKNYKDEFNKQIEKYQKFISKKEEIMAGLNNLVHSTEQEVLKIQALVAKMQDRIMNYSNFENYIQISNTALINIIAIEATIEDYINIVKKSFEKNVLSFNETVKFIRTLSRETMKIKIFKEKLMRKL